MVVVPMDIDDIGACTAEKYFSDVVFHYAIQRFSRPHWGR